MDKNTEVFNQTIALLDTLSEGLQYSSSLISDGKLDEALEMIYDVLGGIESITNALKPYLDQISANNLKVLEVNLLDGFNKMIDIFKLHEETMLRSYLENDVLTSFVDWKTEIERLLKTYYLS